MVSTFLFEQWVVRLFLTVWSQNCLLFCDAWLPELYFNHALFLSYMASSFRHFWKPAIIKAYLVYHICLLIFFNWLLLHSFFSVFSFYNKIVWTFLFVIIWAGMQWVLWTLFPIFIFKPRLDILLIFWIFIFLHVLHLKCIITYLGILTVFEQKLIKEWLLLWVLLYKGFNMVQNVNPGIWNINIFYLCCLWCGHCSLNLIIHWVILLGFRDWVFFFLFPYILLGSGQAR